MSARHFVYGALLGFLFSLVGVGCGSSGTKPSCKPSNCAGCCDKNNECQLGTQNFACGARALLCDECGSTQTCIDNKCQTNGAGGGAGGGSGGSGGAGGSYVGDGGTCNPTSCFGCCTPDGFCRGGNTNMTCGKGGLDCVACTGGNACDKGACAPIMCTTGCKDTAGVCQAGNMDTACGSGGASCQACAMGLVCSNGACVAPCNATTCGSGCCDGTTCVGAPTAAKCGLNGGACTACTGTQVCTNGACVTGAGGGAGGAGGGAAGGAGGGAPGFCNITNCFDGCCNGNTCMGGTSKSNCGIGAAACKTCGTLQACLLQSCFP